MDQREDYAELDARPAWFVRLPTRRRTLVAVIVLAAGAVLLIYFGQYQTDRHYNAHVSIMDAESLARTSFYKNKRNGQFPARLADVQADTDIAEHRLIDAWGKPFRYAVVPNEAGELEPYVWTEQIDADGRTTLIGAKVRPDGSAVRFGLPPKD
jgi:hypothetical protein